MNIYNLSEMSMTIPFGKSILNLPPASMVTLQVEQIFVTKILPAIVASNNKVKFNFDNSENIIVDSTLKSNIIDDKDASKQLKSLQNQLSKKGKLVNSESKPKNDLKAGIPVKSPINVEKVKMPSITVEKAKSKTKK